MRVETVSKNSVKETAQKYSLADALFTSTQQRIHSLLFGQPDKSFYLTEIVNLANIGRGGVQRELQKLESTGLISTTRIGNQKHYQANPDSPLFNELVSIVKKTVGLKQPLTEVLEPLASKIIYGFVFGSVAKGTDNAKSDIDLMIVSDELNLEELFLALAPLETRLGRVVNPTLLNHAEFVEKRKSGKGFISKVLATPIIELIGSVNEN